MYHHGKIYSVNNGFIALTNGTMNDFSLNNIRFLNIGTAPIILYDSTRGAIRELTENEIKSYLTDGAGAYYAVVCQNDFATNSIVVYANAEERI